jgi:hypothetical protein
MMIPFKSTFLVSNTSHTRPKFLMGSAILDGTRGPPLKPGELPVMQAVAGPVWFARRKAALGLDMSDPSSLETLNRTHILIMALDAVIDELPPDADVEALVG